MSDGPAPDDPDQPRQAAAIEQRVVAQLEATGLDYQLVPCQPSLADTEAFCAAYGYDLADSANTIVVVGKSQPPVFAACVILATTRLDVNHVVKVRLGVRRASFAGPEQTREQTGMMIGGVTPFGLPPDLPVWVDQRVFTRQRIVLGGGSRSVKVVGPPGLLRSLPGCQIVEGLAAEVAVPTPDPDSRSPAGTGSGREPPADPGPADPGPA